MNNSLVAKIKQKKAVIAVIGLGHVGLPTAAIFADAGFTVIGVDLQKQLIAKIMSMTLVTHEPALDELVRRVVRTERLKVIDDVGSATEQADIAIICVQTPLAKDGKPDLRFLKNASTGVAHGLAKEKLVIVESTVPPGTVMNVVARILERESGLTCGSDFGLAHSPERILPGNILQEFTTNARLVGGVDRESTEAALELFKCVTKGEIRVTNIANAELAKLAENTFRYINIAYANELALICEKIGADVEEVINLANTHPRVNIHRPGPGVGGPCLTKDPQLLLHFQGRVPLRSRVIKCSEEINRSMPDHFAAEVVKALKIVGKSVRGSCVAVLGTAYKGEVSDVTNSPSEKIIRKLKSLGVDVRVYDPYSQESFGARKVSSIKEASKGADCVLIVTDHRVFADLPLKEMKSVMKVNPVIVDAKRIMDYVKAQKEGFKYYGIGLGAK